MSMDPSLVEKLKARLAERQAKARPDPDTPVADPHPSINEQRTRTVLSDADHFKRVMEDPSAWSGVNVRGVRL